MGTGLSRQFFVCEKRVEQDCLVAAKHRAIEMERSIRQQSSAEVERPVNIDPGYLTLTKFVLASAKDRAHRLYLADGIFAEECLYYLDGGWRARPWTYPDYQRPDVQAFLEEVRRWWKERARRHPA